MFAKIAQLINTYPKPLLAVLIALAIVSGVAGGDVAKRLTSTGFEAPSAESYKAKERIDRTFQQSPSNVVIKIAFKHGSVNDAKNSAIGQKLENRLRHEKYMANVVSYWSTGNQESLRSDDSTQALILGAVQGSEDQTAERVATIASDFSIDNTDYSAGVGGRAEISRQFNKQIEKDLHLAELLAFPITFIILLLVFRTIVAAVLPLVLGGFSIIGSFFVLFILTKFTDVSIYALNLLTMLGLGLAIDYSLFMVARFREQLARGDSVKKAVEHAVERAGKTILISSLTIAASLSALIVFEQPFLRSFAYAGVAVAVITAVGSLLLLPTILRLLGNNINKWHIGSVKNYANGSTFWSKLARFVIKRPLSIASGVAVVLLLFGVPFLSIDLGQGDERALPKDNPVRLVHDDMRKHFSSKETSALEIVSAKDENISLKAINDYAIGLSKMSRVDHVEATTGIYKGGKKVAPAGPTSGQFLAPNATILKVVPNIEAYSSDGEKLVHDVRSYDAPFAVEVGGASARLVDLKDSIYTNLPLGFAIICITVFILFFMMFGSVVLPLKAIVISSLSLSAVFGLMTWIFQEGNLSQLLGFTAVGSIDATMPILMFCIAFGLSMDYELFLLSRIQEFYDKEHNNQNAIVHGIEKTGGIISTAALSIGIVFFAFATSSVTNIKLLGTGLFAAVMIDAFVIRGTLVPALMRLAGKWNWWAPKPLKKFYEKFGFSE